MIINKIKQLFKHNFVKDTATLQAGTLVSTALSFIASVVFARYLGPDNYGQYALIFAFTGLISIFMNFGADHAVLTLLSEAWAKKDKPEIKRLVVFFVKLSLLVGVTIGLLAIIISPWLAGRLYNNPLIGKLARWVLAAVIIRVAFFLLTIILQVVRKIKHLTIIENINKIIYIIVPVGLVLFGFGLRGIVWGHFISAIIFLIFSIYFYSLLIKKTDFLPGFKEIIRGLKENSIRKYFKFGFAIAIDKNLGNLYSILPITFLGMAATEAEVGYFKIAFSYIGLALMFLRPVSRLLTVQLPKSKTYSMQDLKAHFFKTALYSFLLVIVIIVPMLLLSKYLVQTFYGIKYLPSVKLIYILWPYALVTAWGVGLGPIFRTLNKMKATIIINSCVIIIGAPVFYWLIKIYGLTGMVITSFSWIGVSMLISFIYIGQYFKKI